MKRTENQSEASSGILSGHPGKTFRFKHFLYQNISCKSLSQAGTISRGLLIILLIFLISSCKKNDYVPLEVGTGVVDITPPVGFPRYGYPPVSSTGVKDPLLAKAIVFKQGDITGALLVCHLLGIPRDLSRIVREKVSQKTGIPFQNISISATHSHTSPGITLNFREYADRESSGKLTDEDKESYFSFLIEGMTKAVANANDNRKEVEFISGKGYAPGLSFNRRYLMTDGRVRFNPGRLNPQIVKPAGPVDPEVNFVLFSTPGNDSFSESLTVFASHYVRGGTEFSADYPFYLQKRYNELFGESHVSLFAPGACGNVNIVDVFGKPEDPEIKVKQVGYRLADAVKSAIPQGKKGIPELEIVNKIIYLPIQDFTSEELEWSVNNSEPLYPERDFLVQRRRLKISVWGVQPPLKELRNHEAVPPAVSGEPWLIPVEIHVFKLDEQTAIVTMPGELFTELGIDLKKRSPFTNTMLIELANADIAYIPTLEGFKEGDYEAVNSRLVPGSGEKMIDEALQILEDLRYQE